MRAFVFTDKSLERYAGRFVWLSIDTESAKNAVFLAKYPIPALPTLMVIDPAKGSVALRYVGGATAPQLARLLDDGERAVKGKGKSTANEALARADRLGTAGKNAEAARAYEEALAVAPKGWPSYGRAAEGAVFALSSANPSRCAALARDLYPKLAGTPSGAVIASGGLDCAVGLPADATNRSELIAALEKASSESLRDPNIALSGDDRSGLYISLIGAREDAKDKEGTRKLSEEWSHFLDAEASRATNAEQRMVYDSHRISAYIAIGKPELAVPMLEQSERDSPDDYNPPARLALAFKTMGKFAEALAANDRALARVYGPRKLGILRTRMDIYQAMGDNASARKTVAEAVAYAEALPIGQRNDKTIAALKKKLEGIAQ